MAKDSKWLIVRPFKAIFSRWGSLHSPWVSADTTSNVAILAAHSAKNVKWRWLLVVLSEISFRFLYTSLILNMYILGILVWIYCFSFFVTDTVSSKLFCCCEFLHCGINKVLLPLPRQSSQITLVYQMHLFVQACNFPNGSPNQLFEKKSKLTMTVEMAASWSLI